LGGGIYNQNGVVALRGSTVLENTAKTLGGGIFATDGGTVTRDAESAVIENKPDNCIGADACPA
jgi:predicted outer membrane repeat protein